MSEASSDWFPLVGGDPCPGDPEAWDAVVHHWDQRSQTVDSYQHTVQQYTSIDAEGHRFRSLENIFSEAARVIGLISEEFRQAAIETNSWRNKLEDMQDRAQEAWRDARDAQDLIDDLQGRITALENSSRQEDGSIDPDALYTIGGDFGDGGLRGEIIEAQQRIAAAQEVVDDIRDEYDREASLTIDRYHFNPVDILVNKDNPARSVLSDAARFMWDLHPSPDDEHWGEYVSLQKDLFFTGIGTIEKAMASVRLGLGEGSGARRSQTLVKLFNYSEPVYFPSGFKEKIKLASGVIGSRLDRVDLQSAVKGRLDANMKNLDTWSKKLLGDTDQLATGIAQAVRGAFPKYQLPLSAVSNDQKIQDKGKTKNIIADNARYLSEHVGGKIGQAAEYMPMVGKLSKHIPWAGDAISAGVTYSDYYENDQHQSSDETEKQIRAGAASVTTTGASMGGAAVGAATGAAIGSVVPGVGTAIGGLVGGFVGAVAGGVAGEEAVKKTGFDDIVADVTGGMYNGIKGIFGG